MSSPEVVECTQEEWTLVAEDVRNATVFAFSPSVEMVITYREHDEAAPDDAETEEGRPLRVSGVEIAHTTGVDIYVWTAAEGASVLVHA